MSFAVKITAKMLRFPRRVAQADPENGSNQFPHANFSFLSSREVSYPVVYAIVRAGGRQEKVSVGDFVTLNRVPGGVGSTIELPAVLLVDGEKITSDAKDLAKVKVKAEILEDLRGPKIVIQKFKNKTGYKKRQGHRQALTKVKVTSIA
ncbi:LSU ribosomal protein L21P [Renibacterium salmoninarum ATCC 33209]|uniref:Large ribosomal subunit protein bL21 n=1 Tax=Renibacterium salmoninarum (strain ATCC 33209 / DSM 20767 / JCM 11484 / NBRC 15589 / NCIMB 2235) TaxID=288705 RepID=A9WUU4_RENSM|nr:LSU ribosomal protein L21P [Renibacterium salmoninarum ATCC 33209]